MGMRAFRTIMVAALLMGAATMAMAEVYPPATYQDPAWAPQWFKDCTQYKVWADWYFDQEDPTSAYFADNEGWNWEFQDLGDPSVGDTPNMHDDAMLYLTGNANWVAEHQGRTGVVGGDSPVDFHTWMDNEEAPLTKQVWFQFDAWVTLTHWSDLADSVSLWGMGGPAGILPQSIELADPMPGGWRTVTAYWEIPQPEWEYVDIIFDVPNEPLFIDDVKIATQCVPEPGVVTMVVLGGLLVIGRRRSRTG